PGDLLLTGTPEGVGALLPGDEVEADIEGVLSVAWRVN
ncbi:MAG: fumarylacetoacetate hydrolase family protein, partial [Bdellovibrionota bacterium]